MSLFKRREAPPTQQPLLVGVLVDVSYSMTQSIRNVAAENTTRLLGFREAFKNMVEKAKQLPQTAPFEPSFEMFALGFGFNNPLYFLLGGRGQTFAT